MVAKFLEISGRFLFLKIRFPFFLLLLGLFPFCSIFFLLLEQNQVHFLQEQYSQAVKKGSGATSRKRARDAFFARYGKSNPYFLDQHIESLRFLEREKEQLKAWQSHPAIAEKESIQKRLQFLEGSQNRLSFSESEIRAYENCKETVEKQREPIQLDGEDLQHLLYLVEDTSTHSRDLAGRPQLVISQFKLRKKKISKLNQVFEVSLHLLKREFQ